MSKKSKKKIESEVSEAPIEAKEVEVDEAAEVVEALKESDNTSMSGEVKTKVDLHDEVVTSDNESPTETKSEDWKEKAKSDLSDIELKQELLLEKQESILTSLVLKLNNDKNLKVKESSVLSYYGGNESPFIFVIKLKNGKVYRINVDK